MNIVVWIEDIANLPEFWAGFLYTREFQVMTMTVAGSGERECYRTMGSLTLYYY
jgi:hypothetical protein